MADLNHRDVTPRSRSTMVWNFLYSCTIIIAGKR